MNKTEKYDLKIAFCTFVKFCILVFLWQKRQLTTNPQRHKIFTKSDV